MRIHLHLATLLCIALLSLIIILGTAAETPNIIPQKPSPESLVQQAWQNARSSGIYHFQTDVLQLAHPGPALINVGRTTTDEALHLEGGTNLPDESLFLRLWTAGSDSSAESTLDMGAEGDHVYGRCSTCEEGLGTVEHLINAQGGIARTRSHRKRG